MSQTHRIRPGSLSDIHSAASLYATSFDKESLLDYMFPGRHVNSGPFFRWLTHRFRIRYWTPGYVLTMAEAVDEKDKSNPRPVGFSWWHRPEESLSFRERWLTPYAWFAPIMRAILNLQSYLFPPGTTDPHRMGIYDRVFSTIELDIINTPRRQNAWYLSSLGVDPECQGSGVGSSLLMDGLQQADRAGAATWLVGLRGLDAYYSRFGYIEVGRANVGELKDWDGGIIMFRND